MCRYTLGEMLESSSPSLPKVALVIPTYNRGHIVHKAIESALAQDYGNLVVIVVDDGSTDNTSEVLDGFKADPRFSVVVRPQNGGVMAAKNTGIEALPADTDYFGILDSDDTLLPDAVSVLAANFQESGGSSYSQVFGWCVDADTQEWTGTMRYRAGPISYEDVLCGRFDGEFWQLIKKSLLEQMRFDARAGGNEAMVWWPLIKLEPALLVDHIVRRYDRSGEDRVNRPAFTRDGAERKMWGYSALLDRTGRDMLATCPQRFGFMSLELAKWAALAGNRQMYSQSLSKAWRASPSARVLKVGLLSLAPSGVLRFLYSVLYNQSR